MFDDLFVLTLTHTYSPAIGQEKKSALFYASEKGHSKVVRKLLDSGADVNEVYSLPPRDRYSWSQESKSTVLMTASRWGHLKVVQELLKEKADVNTEDQVCQLFENLSARLSQRSEKEMVVVLFAIPILIGMQIICF